MQQDRSVAPGPINAEPIDSAQGMSKFEIGIAIVLTAMAIGLHFLYIFNALYDSDEPQHLHVAWAWAHGLMQYRDLFDNHMPLFHMLCGPIVVVLGDRADLLILMRLAMLPIWAVSVFCIYVIGRSLFSRRAAFWAVIWTITFYPLFFTWMQFRADILWAMCWFVSIAILLKEPLTMRRAICAGLAAGGAAGASLKTSFLLVSLGGAAAATILITISIYPWRKNLLRIAGLAGMFIVPVVLIPLLLGSYFYFRGAFSSFYYCIVEHNMVASYSNPLRNIILITVALAGGIAVAIAMVRFNKDGKIVVRRVFLILLGSILFAVFNMLPTITEQDYLVIYPLLLIVGAGVMEGAAGRILLNSRHSGSLASHVVMPALPVIQLIIIMVMTPWQSQLTGDLQRWSDILKLTEPNQTVMDAKGELIFRPRGCRYVFEWVTRERIDCGLFKDDIIEQLVANNTYVSVRENRIHRFPQRDKEFIQQNYISIGSLLVAGKMFNQSNTGNVEFNILLSGVYAIVTPYGPAKGYIDAQPYGGPCMLKPGKHTYKLAPDETSIAVVWSQAIERGFWPVEFVGEGRSNVSGI
jgi:hypothetical protein